MASIQNIIDSFCEGKEATNGNSLSSVNKGDKTFLVGYNWAVYAFRWLGQFYFFPDWYGYSLTTSKHYNKAHYIAGNVAGPQGVCLEDSGKPQLSDYESITTSPLNT